MRPFKSKRRSIDIGSHSRPSIESILGISCTQTLIALPPSTSKQTILRLETCPNSRSFFAEVRRLFPEASMAMGARDSASSLTDRPFVGHHGDQITWKRDGRAENSNNLEIAACTVVLYCPRPLDIPRKCDRPLCGICAKAQASSRGQRYAHGA